MKNLVIILATFLSLSAHAQKQVIPVTEDFKILESPYVSIVDQKLVFKGNADKAMKIALPLTFTGTENTIDYTLFFPNRDKNYWGRLIFCFSSGDFINVDHSVDQSLNISYYGDNSSNPESIREWKQVKMPQAMFEVKVEMAENTFSIYVNGQLENKIKTKGGTLQKVLAYTKADPTYEWKISRFSAKNVEKNTVKQLDLPLGQLPQKLNSASSTELPDLNPMVSADGNTLFFTRDIDRYNKAMYCKRQANGAWSESAELPDPVNKDKHNVSIASPGVDGSSFYITGYRYEYGSHAKIEGVSRTRQTAEGFEDFTPIKIEGYENESKSRSYVLSADQEFMILSIVTDASQGQKDIYVSFLSQDKKGVPVYTPPLNLGSVINTSGNEVFGYLAPDNTTLYFSSDGHHGYGDCDFFVSKRLDDSWTNWSDPINLGPIINSYGWDGYFTTDAKGETAFISAQREGDASTDIYQVKLVEETKPDPVLIVKGKILNKETNEPIEADIVFRPISKEANPRYASTNALTGEYKVVFQKGNNYEILAEKNGYYPISDFLDLTDLRSFENITKDLFLTPISKGEIIRLNNIFFEFGKTTLNAMSDYELDRLADLLNKNKKMNIEIGGHSDNVGSETANIKISDERAKAVVTYLVSQGVSADRLQSKGYGPKKPLKSNDTEEGRSYNRRVEFTIL